MRISDEPSKQRLIKFAAYIFGVQLLSIFSTTTPIVSAPLQFDTEVTRLAAQYKVDESLARRIIWCESKNNPEAVNHESVVGKDIGYWQINDYFWEDRLRKLGWEITDQWDNLEAGFWILSRYTSEPWKWSKGCWNGGVE